MAVISKPVAIGPCVEADIPSVLAFEAAMAVELGCPADDPRGAYDADWFSDCCRGTFQRDNGHSLPARTLIARQGARVVGGIMCYLDRARFSPGGAPAPGGRKRRRAVVQPFVELFWVYVAPAARKARVGAALLAAALADARQAWPDAERVRLHCITTNLTGHAFWTRMGFANTRRVKDYPVEEMSAWRMERAVHGALPPPEAAGERDDPLPRALVVCGVAGCGKSTIGALLARRLGRSFFDADSLHPPSNLAKMGRGEALTDADREPWLARVAEELARRFHAAGPPTVLACSALRAKYRAALRGSLGRDEVGFVLLSVEPELVAARVGAREQAGAHFMPASLVQSQFALLEPLIEEDEPCLALPVGAGAAPDAVVDELLERWAEAAESREAIGRKGL